MSLPRARQSVIVCSLVLLFGTMGLSGCSTTIDNGSITFSILGGIFELTLDTTTAGGLMTVDLTDYFSYIWQITVGKADAAHFYHIEPYGPSYDTAIAATTVGLGFSEAGADGAVLDLMNATDLSSAITGLTITVSGRQAV